MADGGIDARWLRAALSLARRRVGSVAPNPAVAALIVRDGRLLGRGITGSGGRPHAETVAIAAATLAFGAETLRGSTLYVTLEPCAHHGLTPPCADAIVSAGISRVVCPLQDPDPRVAGRGFARLREAGVALDTGLLVAEARAVNAGFLSRIERGRPHVTLKLAASLDGRIATASGESRWITGVQSRLRVHAMRAQADAVMVGAGTARADDPMLNVRGCGPDTAQPIRIVLDTTLSLPTGGRLAASAREQPVWALHGAGAAIRSQKALAALGVLPIASELDPEGGVALAPALAQLAAQGVTRLLCEGGGRLAAGLLRAGLVDELALFSAGTALGGDALSAVGHLGLAALDDAPRLAVVGVEMLGPDTLSLWRPIRYH
ncbi:MAG: bifunctional diaminohydroxyphosphoribosylaminopyrimidine deaminase/5-amino-6-(5-phosphoribosylamino)uracil reductase RibD [Pseudomonadota bacterium]